MIGLKLICLKTGICKCGFPVRKIEEYIKELSFAGKSFVVYQYDKNLEEREKEVFRYNGEQVYEDKCCLSCKDCKSRKETDEEILERIIQKAEENKNC